jgi:hypothetical protein
LALISQDRPNMKIRPLTAAFLIMIILIGLYAPFTSAQTLTKTDFQQQTFTKTLDYYDYVRQYATNNNLTLPANFNQTHANMYMTYINNSGVQLLYAGLEGLSNNSDTLRIPMQSILMHYKTNTFRDVLSASTFLMLLAFNETTNSIYPNSPDQKDTLYASFSLGFDLTTFNNTLPNLNSKTTTIPLVTSANGLEYTWGMQYTNLTALWWRTWLNSNDTSFNSSVFPVAISTYDELTFNYKLTIDPIAGTATLQENHIIGRMRDLIVGVIPLLWTHYNSTGEYGMLGRKISDQTIYNYIENQGIKMSILNLQTSILADHTTYSQITTNQDSQTETTANIASISTFTEDGQKISTTNFSNKQTYNLYNYTADSTETTFNSYDSLTRTISAAGFADESGLYAYHVSLMKLLPLTVAHICPELYAKAITTIGNITKADYFYSISYPTYSGYKIEHDPTFIAYITPQGTQQSTSPIETTSPSTSLSAEPTGTQTSNNPSNSNGTIITVMAIVAIVAIVAVVVLLMRHKKTKN